MIVEELQSSLEAHVLRVIGRGAERKVDQALQGVLWMWLDVGDED